MVQKRSDTFHVSQTPPGWVVRGWGQETYTGEFLTVEGSLSVTAVLAGFTILSEDTSSLPLIEYRRLTRGKERATDQAYYSLMHDAPNPEHTSMVFREFLQGHLLGWGNFYGQMIWDRKGVVREIWPLRPDRMTVFRDGGIRKYLYRPLKGPERAFRQDEVLHIPAFGFDGLTGLSRISQARNAIALSIAAEKYGSKFVQNDARPGVVLKHPQALGDDAFKHLRESWSAMHQGVDNSHKPAILEEGMDIATIGIPPEDAQFLQTRQFQVAEIARIFRIPPHMMGDVTKTSSWGTGIEQQELGYLSHTLRPWLTRIEQQLNKDLLLPEERKVYFFEHLVDGMLRTDINARFTAYAQAITNGFMTRNEAREKENWNPLDGLDEPLVPLNMAVAGTTPTPRSIQPLLRDMAERVLRREINELRDAVKRTKDRPEKYTAWLEQFYKSDLRMHIAQQLKPFVEAGYFSEDRADEIIGAYCAQRGDLMTWKMEEPTADHLMSLFEE
jgi:HK97 family phage portal protein